MRNRYINTGWFITILIALTPVILWQIALPRPWDNIQNIFSNIGSLTGLAGMALFAWNVILSARLKIYNKLFLGLDNTYRAHHIIGSTAFILLLIHPLAITYRYFLSSPASAFEFLIPSLDYPFRIIGNLALGLMLILMVVTLYIKVKYEWFIMAQRSLGLVLFLGGIHAVFVSGSSLKGGVPSLTIYFGLLLAMALIVYVYRSIFHGNFHKYYNYEVEKVTNYSTGIYDLVLRPVEARTMQFKPGQFAFIKLDAEGLLSQSHPFSMSSAADDKYLRFSIKDLGEYTKALDHAMPSTKVKVDGPYGTFSNKILLTSRQVWIAGGIGVSPFLSMARSLDAGQQVDLYYSTKTAEEAVYLDELKKIAKDKPNFKVLPFYSDAKGFLTADYIFEHSKQLENANYMICGPASLMKAIRTQLKAKGVKRKNINTEEFNLG